MPDPSQRILVGEFGRAVGLKGEVRLKSYTAEPEGIADYKPLLTSDGRDLSLVSVRLLPGTPDMLVAKVKGISDRNAAEALNRVGVYVTRAQLKPADDEDEYLQADLIGLAVYGPDDTHLGEVVGFANYGAGDILEIRRLSGGPTALVSFQDAFVPHVDIPAGRLTIADAALIAPDTPPSKSPRANKAPRS